MNPSNVKFARGLHGIYALSSVLLCAAMQTGCERAPASASNSLPPAKKLPLAPHPEYANWSQFPVGTEIVRKDTLASVNGSTFLFMRLRLIEKNDQRVVLESQSAIEQNGKRQDSDVNQANYPATFEIPEGMKIEQFEAPALKAERQDNEKLQILGREIDCEVYRFVDQSEAGPVDVVLWRSQRIPGRQVRKIITDRNGLVLSSSDLMHISSDEAS